MQWIDTNITGYITFTLYKMLTLIIYKMTLFKQVMVRNNKNSTFADDDEPTHG